MAVAVRQPRLLNENGWTEKGRLRPSAAELHLKLNGISYGVLTMGWDDEALPIRAWVEMYTSKGSAGLYRITRADSRRFQTCAYTVQHAIDTLNDSLWREQGDFTGNAEAFLRKLLSFQNKAYWQLGTCEDTDNYKLTGINYNKLSDMLTEFVESRTGYYLTYDFSTWPWTVNWKRLPAGVRCEWRVRRNVRSCSVTTFDTEQCTRVHYTVTPAEGQEADPTIHVLDDAEAQQHYGVIERAISISAEDVANPAAFAAQFLQDHAEPGVQINVEGYEFYKQTGDSLDSYDVGDLARCIVGGIGGPLRERIVVLNYPDLIGTPESVSGELANSLPKFSESLATASKTAAAASRSARASARAVEKQEKEITNWKQVVTYHGNALDNTGITAFYESGIEMDATSGVKIYSLEEGIQALYAAIQVNSKAIDAKVGSDALQGLLHIDQLSTELGNVMTGSNGETIAANIVTKINNNQGTIYLNSDHVKLKDGSIITASTLDARLADIDKIVANTISASTVVSAATGNFQDLWIYGSSGGNEFAAKVDNAINSITPYTPSDPGKIGFKYTTLANPVGQPVDFNIADTEYYRNHVGIEATGLTVTEIGEAPYNNHSADEITTPEIKAGTSAKYYLIQATAKDGTTTVYKKFTLPAASAPPVTASIDDITGTSIAANHIKDTSIPLTASGTNVAAYTENLTLEETTYQVGSITRPCVVLKLDGSVIGRIYTGNSYNRGWDAAADVVVLPVSSASPGQSMALSVPYKRTANGTTTRGTDQITYTLRVDQKYAYISTVGGNDSVINYAKYEHNQYTLGQDSVSASLPTGTPPPGTNASELSPGTYALTLTKGSTPSVLGYYTVPAAAVVTPKVSKGEWSGGSIKFTAGTSGEDEATVALKMSVDTGTNKSTVIKVLDGQTETGNSMTVYLKADNDNCYITSTDYTPNANNTLARITNPKTAPAVTVNVEKGSWSSGAIQFTTNPASGTGANVSLSFVTAQNESNGNANISVVDSSAPYSSSRPQSVLSLPLVLTCENDAAYLRDGSKIIAKVPNNKTTPTVSASIDMIELRTVGGVQYRYDKTEKDFTIYVQASGTNVSPKTDGQLHIGGSAAFNHGRDSVKITSVERVASCAFDHDAQTAKQDVKVTLDNGQSYTIHENFSDVYRDGRAGRDADTTIEYAVDLASDGVYFDTVDEGLTINVSDIYQAGRDYTPPVLNWYTYSPTGGDVPIYVQSVGSSSGSSGSIGEAIGNLLNKFTVSTTIAFYPYTPVEVVGTLKGYTQVTYNGTTYLLDPSNLKQSETDLSKDHRIGIKDLTAYAVSTTMTGLIHTGGATSGISVYLEPYNGTAKNYTSSYVPSSDFSSYRANGSASSYFYEMAAKSDYYGRHEKTDYSGDIQHKAIFEILYSDGNTETVVVSFNSYAKAADEVVYTYPGYIDANNYVNLRSDATTAGTVMAKVPDRSTVMCQYNPNGYTGTWMPVQYGGKTGYIQSKFIEGTKDWNDLNTKTISTITLVGVAHAMGSSKKDIIVTLHPQKNGMKFTTSYATESNEYTYDWAVTNTDTDTYLLHPASGCYMYHSKSAYSSTMRMRVKLNVTYTNSSKFPPETVVLQVDSVAK